MRLFEEKFELFFDPCNHLVRFEKDSTLAQDQSDEGIAFAAHILVRQKLVNCFETSLQKSLKMFFVFSFITEEIVEKDHGSVIDYFLVNTSE